MAQLSIVSGKGGVGKTTLSSALALSYAAAGQRTVLVSLENTDERHPVFGQAFGYEGSAVDGVDGSLRLLRIEAMPAVREYVRRKLPFGRLYEGAFNSRAFRDFASAAPGFEELMVLGKLYDLLTAAPFDQVVFDAPASGHLQQLLRVPKATQEAVRFGPLFDVARKIERRFKDRAQCRLLIPCLPEEMPLRESGELAAFVQGALGMSVQLLLNRLQLSALSSTQVAELRELGAAHPELAATVALGCRSHDRIQAFEALSAMAAQLHEELPGLLQRALRLGTVHPAGKVDEAATGDDWAFGHARRVAAALAGQLRELTGPWPVAEVSGS